jgi:hypothetical protein
VSNIRVVAVNEADSAIISGEGSNLIANGHTFGSWTMIAASVPGGTFANRRGLAIARKLQEDLTTGQHAAFTTYAGTTGITYTHSVHAKAAGRSLLWITVTSGQGAVFDLATGSVAALIAGLPSGNARITDMGDGWYRCEVTRTATATASTNMALSAATSAASFSYAGDGSSGVLLDDARIEAKPVASDGGFAASLPPGNLQLEGRARVARTVGVSGDRLIEGEWASAKALSACVLYRTNLTSQATWRLQCWDAVGQSGNLVYDSTTVKALPALGFGEFPFGTIPWGASVFTGWGKPFAVLWFPPTLVRSFRLTLSDTGNPDGYIEAKRLVLGSYFEPSINVSYGVDCRWESDSEQARTQGGSIRTDRRAIYRVLTGALGWLSAAERARWMEIARRAELSSEIFVSVFPEAGASTERDYAMLGKFTKMPSLNHHRVDLWGSQFEISEV